MQAVSAFSCKNIPYNFYQNVKLSTFAFLYGLCYINSMEGWQMNQESLEKQIIRKQDLYIRQLEEQLAVYKQKDKAQELLIEQLNRTLQLFADEISDKKSESGGRADAHE